MSLPIPIPSQKDNLTGYAVLAFSLILVGCNLTEPKNEFSEKFADLPLTENTSGLNLLR